MELTSVLFARTDLLDPVLHAFICPNPEGALATARVAEQEIMAGRTSGKLHGVPIDLNDLIDVAGVPTTCPYKVPAGPRGHVRR